MKATREGTTRKRFSWSRMPGAIEKLQEGLTEALAELGPGNKRVDDIANFIRDRYFVDMSHSAVRAALQRYVLTPKFSKGIAGVAREPATVEPADVFLYLQAFKCPYCRRMTVLGESEDKKHEKSA